MAEINQWRELYTRWSRKLHTVGDPKLDALYNLVVNQGLNYRDQKITAGDYFSGFISRSSTVPEVIYRVVKTKDQPLIIEDVSTDIDYSGISNGSFTLTTKVYMSNSNANTWSYTGGIPAKTGKPLNVEFINKIADFDLIVLPDVTLDPASEPDFIIYYSQYFRDSSGNRDMLTGVNSDFFSDDRKLIIPPNTEMLIESTTSGDNGNTAEIRSFIKFIEPGEI